MWVRRSLIAVVILSFLTVPVFAYRTEEPSPISEWDCPSFSRLNHYLHELWNITNGRYNLDTLTATPDGTRQGTRGELVYAAYGGDEYICVNSSTTAQGTTWTCVNITTFGSICGTTSDTQILFNNAGSCGGEAPLTWNYTNDLLTIDPADTTGVSSEENALLSAAQTITLSSGSTVANMRQNQFLASTLNGIVGGATETVTDSATVFIDAAPSGTNITLTTTADLMFGEGTTTATLIKVQDETTTNTTGRGLTIEGADGIGSGDGGVITLKSGTGGTSGNSPGGNLNITAGDGGTTDDDGGDVNITGGLATGNGAGGDVLLEGGDTGASGVAGVVKILTNVGTGNVAGGDFQVFLASGSGTGTGGALDLEAGTGRASGAIGGRAYITAGGFDADGAAGGDVLIKSGTSTSNKDGNSGDVILIAGAGSTTGGGPSDAGDIRLIAAIGIGGGANGSVKIGAGSQVASGGTNDGGTYIFDFNPTTGIAQLGAAGLDGQLIFYNELGVTDYTTTIGSSASQSANVSYTLPPDDGDAGEQLQTNGSGVLTWETSGGITLAAGVWTPTTNNIANLDSSSAAEGQYIRVGTTVTGSIQLTVNPALTATSTQLELDLPVASNFGATSDAAGSCGGSDIASEVAEVRADATSNELEILWVTTSLAEHEIACSFSYQVI